MPNWRNMGRGAINLDRSSTIPATRYRGAVPHVGTTCVGMWCCIRSIAAQVALGFHHLSPVTNCVRPISALAYDQSQTHVVGHVQGPRENEHVEMSHCDMPGSTTARPLLQRRWCRLMIGVALLASGVTQSNAQMGGGPIGNLPMGGGHGGRQRNQQRGPAHTASLPPPVASEPWPRLDAGAILCKSRDDLARYQTLGTAGPNAAPLVCSVIQNRTAIRILDRDGPSRTHVVTTDATKQAGWTNAYLPSKGSTSGVTSTSSGQ
jgi:hypothetical protein